MIRNDILIFSISYIIDITENKWDKTNVNFIKKQSIHSSLAK